MRRRQLQAGMTLLELSVGTMVMMMVLAGFLGLLSFTLRIFDDTETRIDLSQSSSLATRKLMEDLRSSMRIEIEPGGRRLHYDIPRLANALDPITLEREVIIPLTSAGTRTVSVNSAGELVDEGTGEVYLRNIARTDPDPQSSQFGQEYSPFQLTTIGSRRALSINFITRQDGASGERWVRDKTTVVLRNGS